MFLNEERSDAEDQLSALRYSWRLDDGDWSEPQIHRTRALTDLSEGPHTFTVLAIDTDGNLDPILAVREFEYEDWVRTHDWKGLVTAPGPCAWNPPLVRTYYDEWPAYSASNWGVNVSAGDIDGDGYDEIVTGAKPVLRE